MMKRTILAVIIPGLLAAGAVNAAEVYNKDGNKLNLNGRMAGIHYFSDNEKEDGDSSYARLGFRGETQINDQLTGFGQWEYQFSASRSEKGIDSKDGNKTRLGFVGLKFADWGSIDYGRNYGVVYDAYAWTDVLPEFGGDSAYGDNFMNGRTTGVFTYRNYDFFGQVEGLNFAAQYQGKNERNEAKYSNGDGWGVSTTYNMDNLIQGLNIAGAYSSSDRTDAQTRSLNGKGDRAESWASALKYNANSIYLAALYGETRNQTPISGGFANKAQNFEAVAQYDTGFGLKPSVAYISSKGKDIEGIGSADIIKYVDVGASYQFNSNMTGFVDYRINLLDNDNALNLNTDDIVALGLIYQF